MDTNKLKEEIEQAIATQKTRLEYLKTCKREKKWHYTKEYLDRQMGMAIGRIESYRDCLRMMETCQILAHLKTEIETPEE